jgi:sulfatase maturation enzyme AslB (radical SAM superfamily)
MKPIMVPANYDYIGIYLTNHCHLQCSYCITRHHQSAFGDRRISMLTADQWIVGLNRLQLPHDIPLTLQGGEPFLYKGIWDILSKVRHKMDILTALPPFLSKQDFLNLDTLEWNRRLAPYPTIRVSYHQEQHDYRELIERIAELQDILSIGLYYLEHPDLENDQIENLRSFAKKNNVELRKKEFLGVVNGIRYGKLLYPDAVAGKRAGIPVLCRNTVAPVGPDGRIFRCHSDLYFQRLEGVLGTILDDEFVFSNDYLICQNYGFCNECDVKVKTNHMQIYGYTSVDIKKII